MRKADHVRELAKMGLDLGRVLLGARALRVRAQCKKAHAYRTDSPKIVDQHLFGLAAFVSSPSSKNDLASRDASIVFRRASRLVGKSSGSEVAQRRDRKG